MVDDDDDDEENPHSASTVPPPASGDAYSAGTIVREAPSEILKILKQQVEAGKAEAAASAAAAAKLQSQDEPSSAQTVVRDLLVHLRTAQEGSAPKTVVRDLLAKLPKDSDGHASEEAVVRELLLDIMKEDREDSSVQTVIRDILLDHDLLPDHAEPPAALASAEPKVVVEDTAPEGPPTERLARLKSIAPRKARANETVWSYVFVAVLAVAAAAIGYVLLT